MAAALSDDDFDDECKIIEELAQPTPQDPDFYKDAKDIQGLKVKKHFDAQWQKWLIYIRKENKGRDKLGNEFSPSVISLSLDDATEAVDSFRKILKEICTTPKGQVPLRLMHPSSKINYHEEGYWTRDVTEKVSSGNLDIRPAFAKDGKIIFRLLSRRPQKDYGKNWLGVCIPIPIQDVVPLITNLRRFCGEVKRDELKRVSSLIDNIPI